MSSHQEKRNAPDVLLAIAAFVTTLTVFAACGGGVSNDVPAARNLEEAVRQGTIEEVRSFVADGANVNATDRDGDPILLAAISRRESYRSPGDMIMGGESTRKDLKALEILVEAGADVNARDSGGNPVLWEAVRRGELEPVRILVEGGADVNARDSRGDPVLLEAIREGELEAVRILVEAGADVNARDSQGQSMLFNARSANSMDQERPFGHPEIEEVLTASGAVLSEDDEQFCESYFSVMEYLEDMEEQWRQLMGTEGPFQGDPFGRDVICRPR